MGNAVQKLIRASSDKINRFGASSDEGRVRSCIGGYVDNTNIDNTCAVIIVYSDSIEIWSTISGERCCRKRYDADIITAATYAKSSNMGPVLVVGFSDGSVIMFTTDLATLRRTLRLPGSLSERAYTDSTHIEPTIKVELGKVSIDTSDYVSYLQIIHDDYILVGDSLGKLHVFSISTATEIKVFQYIADNGKALAQEKVSGAVLIPRVYSEFSAKDMDLVALGTHSGLVAVFALDNEKELILSVKTQMFLIYLNVVTVSGMRYLLTAHARCCSAWLIGLDSGTTEVLDFEDELVSKNLSPFPNTAAFYCDSSKLFFIGDSKGNVFIREFLDTAEGLRMKLIKKASPLSDCCCITSLYFDYALNILLIGDSAGTVRTIENIFVGVNVTETHSSISTNYTVKKTNTKEFDSLSSLSSAHTAPSVVGINDATTSVESDGGIIQFPTVEKRQIGNWRREQDSPTRVNGDVLDEYQDGDEVIRL